MTSFQLAGHTLAVTPERAAYNHIRLAFQARAQAAADEFAQRYPQHFHNLDELHDTCWQVVSGYFQQAVDHAIQLLIERGIVDIDDQRFVEAYLPPYLSWDTDFAVVDDQYLEIVLEKEQRDAYRTARRQNRGRIIGGGFGLEGAVKGMATAGAANLAIGAAHGAFNLVAKGFSAIGDANKKRAIFDSPQTHQQLWSAVFRQVFNIHDALIDAIEARQPQTVHGRVGEADAKRARSLLENLRKGRLAEHEAAGLLVQSLSLNPYDPDSYDFWLQQQGDVQRELETVARYFGIGIVTERKQAWMAKRQAELAFATPEQCHASLIPLQQYAESIGLFDFTPYRHDIQTLAQRLDRERRTVDGREFPTLADAERERERLRAEQFRQDNTAVSTGKDGIKIAFGLMALLVALLTLTVGNQGLGKWVGTAAAIIGILTFREVRSIKALTLMSWVGRGFALIGGIFLLGFVVVLFMSTQPMGAASIGSGILAFVALAGCGWTLERLAREQCTEQGVAALPQRAGRFLGIGVGIGVLLGTLGLGAAAMFGDKPSASVKPAEAAGAVSVPPATPAAAQPASEVALALPFVGKRNFNFYGGNGTEQAITLTGDGQVEVVQFGSSGPSVLYAGKFTNPLAQTGGGELLFRDGKVYLYEKGQPTLDCRGDGNACESELYE